jgi:hypothetical protein
MNLEMNAGILRTAQDWKTFGGLPNSFIGCSLPFDKSISLKGFCRRKRNSPFLYLLFSFLKGFSIKIFLNKINMHRYLVAQQGCQIFLSTKYQNGGKYTKLPGTVPNVHKI